MDVTILVAIQTLLAVIGIFVFAMWLIPGLIVDRFRQNMFQIRDRLFDDAANGLVSFDDPAYTMLRDMMNGFIRFAHRLSLMQIVLYFLFYARRIDPAGKFLEDWKSTLDGRSPEVRERLSEYQIRMHALVIQHILLNSPVLLVTVLLPLFFVLIGTGAFVGIANRFREPLGKLDNSAMIYGN